ncbi:MAG: hypothetical protein AAB895_02785, partial [Patescibacteria group bacterium]
SFSRYIFITLAVGIAVWNFGLFPLLYISLMFYGALQVGVKIFKVHDNLLATIVGLVAYVLTFIIISLATNVSIGFYGTLAIFLVAGLYHKSIVTPVKISLRALNIFDWTLLGIVIIFGSLPQLHWDAVMANLYIAKWYVESNSLAPIAEALTSLFPQNAITYFAVFYKAGGLKMLQLAYLLPFLFSLLMIKKIISHFNISTIGKVIFYLSCMTPIVIFQATNGYYDNLVAMLML